jgi:hypothetical protein
MNAEVYDVTEMWAPRLIGTIDFGVYLPVKGDIFHWKSDLSDDIKAYRVETRTFSMWPPGPTTTVRNLTLHVIRTGQPVDVKTT